MKRLLTSLLGLLLCSAAFAQDIGQPNFPQILPASTVLGRTASSPGPTEAIPFSTLSALLANTITYNSLTLNGAASGAATLTAPAAAGVTAIRFGSVSGTVVAVATSPLTIDATGTIAITGATGKIPAGVAAAFTATPVLGGASIATGNVGLAGTTSGTVTITPQAAAGTYNFNLPITVGTTGQLLTSAGGGSTAMTWSGNGQIVGTATNDAASAGNIGEFVTANASTVSVTTATNTTITSVSLTAGDWDCRANLAFVPAASTSITRLIGSISQTTGLTSTPVTSLVVFSTAANVMVNSSDWPIGPTRELISGTTTINVIANAVFTVSTMTASAILECRRVR